MLLLYAEHVDRIIINDLNPGVAAFWRAVLHDSAALIAQVMRSKIDVKQWRKQLTIYEAGAGDDLTLGFATLFLNRTNRSGILDARPIGGLLQDGPWKIDARFNRKALADRIETISRYRDRIEVHELDGAELLSSFDSREALVYVDPPYLDKGSDLYLDALDWSNHVVLANELRQRHDRWLITYDADPRVTRELFPNERSATFSLAHTAGNQHVGREYVVFSDKLRTPSLRGLGTNARWHPHRSEVSAGSRRNRP